MKVEAIELRRIELPLVSPFRTSFGTESVRDILLVRVLGPEAEGWGECVAMGEPTYSSEYVAGAHAVVRDHLLPRLAAGGTAGGSGPAGWAASGGAPGGSGPAGWAASGGPAAAAGPGAAGGAGAGDAGGAGAGDAGGAGAGDAGGARVPGAADVGPWLAGVRGHPMAKAALEMAFLDAELSARSESLGAYLGAVREEVPSGVSVGIAGSVAALLDTVGGYLAEGYVRIKLKIEPGWDIAPVRAVRERFGDDILLQVDANAAYTLGDAPHLAGLDPFGLLLIEQPLAEDDVAGHAELARRIRTPICLDESITSARAAADAISRGACSIVNIKAGRVGGYLEARRVHDVCAAHGVPVWCGGMLETGLGRAANVALAGLPNFTLPGDTSASSRYWKQDITAPFVLSSGHLRVPTGPGLGVRPDPDVLKEVTTSVEVVPWGAG